MGIYGGVYILLNGTKPKEIESHIKDEKFKDFVKTFGEHRNGNYYLINSRILTKYLNYSLSLPRTQARWFFSLPATKNKENDLLQWVGKTSQILEYKKS